MEIRPYPLARSLFSYVVPKSIIKRPGSGGTYLAEYCYSVWLRHLVCLRKSGLLHHVKEISKVAEIGPGDSLGVGLAALLSGVKEYYAFDVIKHANLEENLKKNGEVFRLFKEREDIPHGERFRSTRPVLENYQFPNDIFGDYIHEAVLEERRIGIESALKGEKGPLKIEYIVPWENNIVNDIGQIDLIFSQAVMEHVIKIEEAYSAMYRWLRKGGIVSHQIDYKAHEMTRSWNGHWFLGQGAWQFLLRGRKYPINRFPHSAHVRAMEKAGFSIELIIPVKAVNPFPGRSPKVKDCRFEEEDMEISSALIIGRKL